MFSLNRAQIIGNVTRDPDVRTTTGGQTVASFGVATNERWKDQQGNLQERAEFHNVVAWRKLAEIVQQYIHKGSKLYVEGRLQTRSWEDQAGQKRYRTEIIADNVIMLDRPGQAAAVGAPLGAPASNANAAPQTSAPGQPQPPTPSSSDEPVINLDDIPF